MHMYDIDVRHCCKGYLDNHTAIVNALRSAAITYVFISWTPLLFCHLVPILKVLTHCEIASTGLLLDRIYLEPKLL